MLPATAAIAVVFTWGVSNYREWQAERAAIERLGELSYWDVSEVSQDILDQLPNDGGFDCGFYVVGMSMTNDSTLPNFFAPIERRLGISFFQRVTRITSHSVHDPEVVLELASFEKLRAITFYYSPTQPDKRPPDESEFAGAIKLFAAMNPKIDVSWPGDPIVHSANGEPIAALDSFAVDDPFPAATDDSFADDPFSARTEDSFVDDPFATVGNTEP